MVKKRYRQLTAIVMAAAMICNTAMVTGAQETGTTEVVTEKVTEKAAEKIPEQPQTVQENVTEAETKPQTEAQSETTVTEAQTQPETAATETQSQENTETAASEAETVADPETSTAGEGAGETLPDSEKTEETQSSSEAAEPDSEVSQTPGAGSEAAEAGTESLAGSEKETGTEGNTESDSELSEGEAEPDQTEKETKTENETEEVKLKMELMDDQGTTLSVQEIKGPNTLTCNGTTHPVDYVDGVYRVQVPYGTERIQFAVKEPEGVDDAKLTKWSGYLVEAQEFWLLCPDDPMKDAFTSSGNVYTAELENYQIDLDNLSLEQMTVYGALADECTYAEVFLYSPDVSAVVLVEIAGEETEPEETETEIITEAGTEEITGAETEIFTESETEIFFEVIENVVMDVMPLAASPQQIESAYDSAGKNLADSAEKYVPTVSSINGEWQILGLARSGQEVDSELYSKYLENVVTEVKEKEGVLHKKKYTEYSRVVIALTSLGEDVTNVGGYNLLEPLADFDQTVWQGVNGAIFALIAFDSHDYEIPIVADGKTQTTRAKLINHILSLEISGGGWALSGNKADPDVTGMAVQALAPYYSSNTAVKNAVDRAVSKLSSLQMSNGGYGSYGVVNSESCSQVIVALTALGIDPNTDSRFVKNGKSVVDALLTYSTSDGGFKHVSSGGVDQMATEQAYYALTSYQRFQNGQTSLYDMSDVALQSDYKKAEEAEKLITVLPAGITLQEKEQVQTAVNAYNALTELQKTLVAPDNYNKLMAAVKTLKELDVELESEQQTESETETEEETEAITEKNTDKNSDSDKDDDKTTGTGTNKKPTGTTKKVNLVSSTGRTGSTVSGSLSRTSTQTTGNPEEENETETETESETGSKQGGTKTPESVTGLIANIRSLLRTSKTSEKLPEDAKDYSDAQVAAILDIYREYTALGETPEFQKLVEQNTLYTDYVEVLDKFGTANHYDEATGTDLRDNEKEVLPWYIQMTVNPQLTAQSDADAVREALKGNGEMLTASDIHLTNLLEGGEWQPEDLVRVSIPMTELGDYEKVAVVHIKDDGTMEFIEAHIAGSNLEFDTDAFSRFGIVGYNGSMEELMQEQEEETLWIYLIPGGAAAVLLFLLLIIRVAGSKKKRV